MQRPSRGFVGLRPPPHFSLQMRLARKGRSPARHQLLRKKNIWLVAGGKPPPPSPASRFCNLCSTLPAKKLS